MSRCLGHCCERFTLSSPLDHIQMSAEMGDLEAAQIAFMVVDEGDGGYTCLYWDPVTRNCGNYEKRPTMCKRHGIDYQCSTPGCALVNVRQLVDKVVEQ